MVLFSEIIMKRNEKGQFSTEQKKDFRIRVTKEEKEMIENERQKKESKLIGEQKMSLQKIFGECEICKYELTLENSNYSEDKNESEESIRRELLKYHFDASEECLITLYENWSEGWQGYDNPTQMTEDFIRENALKLSSKLYDLIYDHIKAENE